MPISEKVICEDEEEGDDGNRGQNGVSEPSFCIAGSWTYQRFFNGP